MRGKDMNWTDERVARLTKLWADGLSASQIAAQLGGVSRNAVIGKVHRLKLPGRAKARTPATTRAKQTRAQGATTAAAHNNESRNPMQGARPQDLAQRPAASAQTVARAIGATLVREEILEDLAVDTREIADVVVPMSRRLVLTELTEQTCKWPIGDPLADEFHFCGNDSPEAGPYCNYHARLAFQPASERRRLR